MASAKFAILDSLEKIWFIEENFLLADISIEVVPEMSLLSLSNADVQFGTKKLI